MSNKKYKQQQVVDIFKEHELILRDVYRNRNTPLYCTDKYGYEYALRLGNLLRGDGRCRFHKGNPYTINNIKRYLRIDGSTLILLESKYIDSQTGMLLQCECGDTFKATWNNVLGGKRYCNFCAKSKRFDGNFNYTKAIKDHCQLKNYTLLTPYIHRSLDKFEYICNKHTEKGTQRTNYNQMINGKKGCRYCGIESGGIKRRSDESKFKEAIERAGFIYVGCDYNNDDSKYKKANIHYICPKHKNKGTQFIKYSNILRSNGRCWYCSGHGRDQQDMQIELNSMHNTIDILEYVDYSSPILAKCRICGREWWTSGTNLIQGHRCPNCSRSNFELRVSSILDNWGYSYQIQHWFEGCKNILPLPFDFYLHDFNVLIEADGEHHYYPIQKWARTNQDAMKMYQKILLHDEIKNQYCKKNNIPLVRIPYWEQDKLEYFLWDQFVKIGILKEIAV